MYRDCVGMIFSYHQAARISVLKAVDLKYIVVVESIESRILNNITSVGPEDFYALAFVVCLGWLIENEILERTNRYILEVHIYNVG